MFDYLNGVQQTEIKIPAVKNSELMNVLHFEIWSMSEYRIFMTCLWLYGLFVISGLALNFWIFLNLQIQVLHHTCAPNLVNLPNTTLCGVQASKSRTQDWPLLHCGIWLPTSKPFRVSDSCCNRHLFPLATCRHLFMTPFWEVTQGVSLSSSPVYLRKVLSK